MDTRSLGIRLFEECCNQARLEILDELLHPNHLFHLADGSLKGIDAYRDLLDGYHKALEPTFTIGHVIAENEFAAVHYEESGVFANDWITGDTVIKATGKKYATFGVELIRATEGLIIEARPGHDSLTHYTQIGLVEWKTDD